jgi:hypothetical protein
MTQKIVIAALAFAIVAIIGFGLLDAARVADEPPEVLRSELEATTAPALVATELPVSDPTATEPPPDAVVAQQPVEATPEPQPVVLAAQSLGEAWGAVGTIAALEDVGLTLATGAGDFFVELGPPTYWQAQGVALALGDVIDVDGFANGEQIHARVVTNAAGAQLILRDASGQPLWSGGSDNGNGDHSAAQPSLQVAPEDWLTVSGVISKVASGNVTLLTDQGEQLALQMGRPDFWQSQGITLTAGDAVEVLGFWSAGEFVAGDIRKTATGETIMLRDPNGRQLWGGPGRGGSGASGNATPADNQGAGNQGAGNQGAGNQGADGQGGTPQGGNQYRGGN